MDKIIEGLNDPYHDKDKYWIENEPESNYLTSRLEDGRKKVLQKTRNLFNRLKTDPVNVLFSEELLYKRLLKNLKESRYAKDTKLWKLINLAENRDVLDNNKVPTRTDSECPFQLLHADLRNLDFLGKKDTFLQYILVIIDLYSLKVYTYSMKPRKQILQKLKLFYDQVWSKRKGERMRLQVDNEFQQ